MKKSLAALLVLVALCVPALAGVMEADGSPAPPPPPPAPLQTAAAYAVPVIAVAVLP